MSFIDREKPFINSLKTMLDNELIANKRIHLVASENILSPLARIPFLLDCQSRYFLDEMSRFGKWFFPEGASIGEIETKILDPLLMELAGADYVNARPISGMNCMTVSLAGLTKPNDVIFAISMEHGGHASTVEIAERLGLSVHFIPFESPYDIDLFALERLLIEHAPTMIYIDQSTFLFPINLKQIRVLIDTFSPKTILYYDSSHANGLIFGKIMSNPLESGAHCYGGSTHKTLPGPHRAFFATNDEEIMLRFKRAAYNFISHHHPASMMSLAITLLEMKFCSGNKYAEQILMNAKTFARALEKNDFFVAASDHGYTKTHQIWAYPKEIGCREYFDLLTKVNIITTCFDALPGIQQPSLRLSVAELTRLGAKSKDVEIIANLMGRLARDPGVSKVIAGEAAEIAQRLCIPQYCLTFEDIQSSIPSENLKKLCEAVYSYTDS